MPEKQISSAISTSAVSEFCCPFPNLNPPKKVKKSKNTGGNTRRVNEVVLVQYCGGVSPVGVPSWVLAIPTVDEGHPQDKMKETEIDKLRLKVIRSQKSDER